MVNCRSAEDHTANTGQGCCRVTEATWADTLWQDTSVRCMWQGCRCCLLTRSQASEKKLHVLQQRKGLQRAESSAEEAELSVWPHWWLDHIQSCQAGKSNQNLNCLARRQFKARQGRTLSNQNHNCLATLVTVQSCQAGKNTVKPKSQLFGTTTVQGKEKQLREKKKPAKSPGCDFRSDDRIQILHDRIGDHGR